MQALPSGGAMASVGAAGDDVADVIGELGLTEKVALAGINTPRQTVVSGESEAVTQVMEHFERQDKKVKALMVSHAFHSQLMEPMLESFREVAQTVSYSEPKLTLISNLSGERAGPEVAEAAYWVRHVREAVRYCDGIRTAMREGAKLFIEVGRALCSEVWGPSV